MIQPQNSHNKSSFDCIADANTTILILGTLPGDKSLQLQEYYGHSRNRFWKVLSAITARDFPTSFPEKTKILLELNIGLWDVAQNANRKGSLDSAIENVLPNNLNHFIETRKKLKVIGFNGAKAAALYDKFFIRRPEITYIQLPSTSPANARISFEDISIAWKKLLQCN